MAFSEKLSASQCGALHEISHGRTSPRGNDTEEEGTQDGVIILDLKFDFAIGCVRALGTK